jgi:hypothetical protein
MPEYDTLNPVQGPIDDWVDLLTTTVGIGLYFPEPIVFKLMFSLWLQESKVPPTQQLHTK